MAAATTQGQPRCQFAGSTTPPHATLAHMRKPALLLATLFCAAVASMLLFWCNAAHHNEPVTDGKPLSYWVEAAYTGDETQEAADAAVRKAGTNAIPFLLKWLQYRTPRWKLILRAFVHTPTKQERVGSPLIWSPPDLMATADAFKTLASTSTSAIPALVRIATDKTAPENAVDAIRALSNIGTNAVPSLLDLMRLPKFPHRDVLVYSLESMKTGGAYELAQALRPLLQDPDLDVRNAATNALLKIAPAFVPATYPPSQ
jgi:hypothetical protein